MGQGEADVLAAYDYHLPPDRIAQKPARRREQARLMRLYRPSGLVEHGQVKDLPEILKPGDLLIMNNTRVVPARLFAFKPSGGMVEVFLLSPARPVEIRLDGAEVHQVLMRGRFNGPSLYLRQNPGIELKLVEKGQRGQALMLFPGSALKLAELYGSTPLPPYIKREGEDKPLDKLRYQTVYADCPGAVAAPTAGLHLSKALLSVLRRMGVGLGYITLHVGYGTFAQPSAAQLAAGQLHGEWVQVAPSLVEQYNACRARGGRVIAVGTTSLRALEWAMAEAGGCLEPAEGECRLMIAPGSKVESVDGLLTNFHLPRTTLLMLVAALAGHENIMAAYKEAVETGYRFYSYGDAMLII